MLFHVDECIVILFGSEDCSHNYNTQRKPLNVVNRKSVITNTIVSDLKSKIIQSIGFSSRNFDGSNLFAE